MTRWLETESVKRVYHDNASYATVRKSGEHSGDQSDSAAEICRRSAGGDPTPRLRQDRTTCPLEAGDPIAVTLPATSTIQHSRRWPW